MHIAIIYGTAAAPGRLTAAMHRFQSCVVAAGVESGLVDLHAHPLEGADGRPVAQCSDAVRAAVDQLSQADAVIGFVPIYRASAPGVLKNLLDLTPLEALENKPFAVVAMGGSDHHYLAADADLAPILTWFGAVSVPFRLYLRPASFAAGVLTEAASAEIASYAHSFLDFTRRLEGLSVWPRPLAAPR